LENIYGGGGGRGRGVTEGVGRSKPEQVTSKLTLLMEMLICQKSFVMKCIPK